MRKLVLSTQNFFQYVSEGSFHLPYNDFSYDLVLAEHVLFLDVEQYDIEFHIQSICELARVGKEVQIYPLVDHTEQPSPLLGPILLALHQENYGVEVKHEKYPILRVWAQECLL